MDRLLTVLALAAERLLEMKGMAASTPIVLGVTYASTLASFGSPLQWLAFFAFVGLGVWIAAANRKKLDTVWGAMVLFSCIFALLTLSVADHMVMHGYAADRILELAPGAGAMGTVLVASVFSIGMVGVIAVEKVRR